MAELKEYDDGSWSYTDLTFQVTESDNLLALYIEGHFIYGVHTLELSPTIKTPLSRRNYLLNKFARTLRDVIDPP